MEEEIKQAYREWLLQEPHYTHLEKLEDHISRFVSWLFEHQQNQQQA